MNPPGSWVSQRECNTCGFSGPEQEFMAFGHYEDGVIVLTHRDQKTDEMVLICCGCAANLGRFLPALVADYVRTALGPVSA